MSRCFGRRLAVLATAWIVILAAGSVVASATTPPEYDGAMYFPSIEGPLAPEEYAWKIVLGPDQELKQLDDQHAAVVYEDGHVAFGIAAEAAHDAVGATVPTSLSVSEPDILTLIVHHRDGNPKAGGAPFNYPVLGGSGWEGGFITGTVAMPAPEKWPEVSADKVTSICSVPGLGNGSLKKARRLLQEAGCRIGDVNRRNGTHAQAGRVVRQRPKAGASLPAGSAVDITLAPRRTPDAR